MFLLLVFCFALISNAFAGVQRETQALSMEEPGTNLIAMPTYTYTRAPGTLSLNANEEIWTPNKWKNRRIYNRFVPIIDWETREPSVWFYTGNEIGDELWQELINKENPPNRTPMLYGGFATPEFKGFYSTLVFNQIDHFSEATFGSRKARINSQKFSFFGENLPAYSGIYGGFGYRSDNDFFKGASVLAGSEYIWAFDKEEWVPLRVSPRIEGNAEFYFLEKSIELYATTEKIQVKDTVKTSKEQINNSFGARFKGEIFGGGLYTSRANNKENVIIWTELNYNFFGLVNKGFVMFNTQTEQKTKLDNVYITDSLEYKINFNNNVSITPGFLFNQNGIKLYSDVDYNYKNLFTKLKVYQNYSLDFESRGFYGELAYKSSLAEAGAAYSKEFIDYYRASSFYKVKPFENLAKIYLKYIFLQNLTFSHELIYSSSWFWNAQIEQKIPKLNASFYAVWLNALSNNKKDFSFGGSNEARFFCGINVAL